MSSDLPVVPHWIDGARRASASGRTAPVYNPATGEIQAQVALADEAEVAEAVASARRGFERWSECPLGRRREVLLRFRELLDERKPQLAAILTAEHGTVLSAAMNEIQRAQEVVDVAADLPQLAAGVGPESASADAEVSSLPQSLGVAGIVSAAGFPATPPLRLVPSAIAAGSSVIVKPGEHAPSAALWLAELWREAGLPGGVFTVLNGDALAIDGLLASPGVDTIRFEGSAPDARHVSETAAKHGKRAQVFGGAKHRLLVLPDADLDPVADRAIEAAYRGGGHPAVIPVVLAVEPVADELVARIARRIAHLTVGNGAAIPEPDLGPLPTEKHRDRVRERIDAAEREGAIIVVDGRRIAVDGHENGFFVGPTLIDRPLAAPRTRAEEVFGPVLEVVRVRSFEEGLRLIGSGATARGDGATIFTSEGGAARRFQREAGTATSW